MIHRLARPRALALALTLAWMPGAQAAEGELPPGLTPLTVAPDVPRTADGKPDMQGFWDAKTLTPLQRPADADGKVLDEDAALEIEGETAEYFEERNAPSSGDREAPPVGGDGSTGAAGGVGGYNAFWIDIGDSVNEVNGELRSSIVVHPENGRIPSMTAAARARRAEARRGRRGAGRYDDPELRPLAERCLLSFGSGGGPPALPVMYNNLKQIVQTPDHVMLLNEMVHDARVFKLNGEHGPDAVYRWLGDSVARWEGDSLVVETRNLHPQNRFRGASEKLVVTERFTRVSRDALVYQFTLDDPETWEEPWSGEYAWRRSEEPLYEYACHEGNYALVSILKGARLEEADRERERTTDRSDASEEE